MVLMFECETLLPRIRRLPVISLLAIGRPYLAQLTPMFKRGARQFSAKNADSTESQRSGARHGSLPFVPDWSTRLNKPPEVRGFLR